MHAVNLCVITGNRGFTPHSDVDTSLDDTGAEDSQVLDNSDETQTENVNNDGLQTGEQGDDGAPVAADDVNDDAGDPQVSWRRFELNVGAITAYGLSKKNGFTGSEAEWLHMLNDRVTSNEKGVAGGVATLDLNGLIPTNQIPGAYDDVIDGYYDSAADKFYKDVEKTNEVIGESGKIYVDITGAPIQYRYGGSTFVRITTNEVTAMTDSDILEILST